MTTTGNLCYAQSGGVTAVINATAAAIIEAARQSKRIHRVYAGKNGILGVLNEELYETWRESPATIAALHHTPGGAFGSCRIKLPDPREELASYRRLLDIFEAHDIRHFLYNGGNDSADTSLKISAAMKTLGGKITCIGVPKTIDNDLVGTDCCPGFGSVAKYVAVSVQETALDLASMHKTSTKVFVMEVMGRHAGWIAAAAGLVGDEESPIMILFPEKPFNPKDFTDKLRRHIDKQGYAVVVASEGIKNRDGTFLSAAETRDQFAHQQLGGVAPKIAALIKAQLGHKCHWAVADYLQRSARHLASACDLKQAIATGKAAVKMALAGADGYMPVIRRKQDKPYRWEIREAALVEIANREKVLPKEYLSRDGYQITAACRRYLQPLIEGETPPPFRAGLPKIAQLKNRLVTPKLPAWKSR